MIFSNEVDSLFFATFVYLDFRFWSDLESDYELNELTIGKVIDALRDRSNNFAQDYLTLRFGGKELKMWREFIDNENNANMLCSTKFRDWKITNVKNCNAIGNGGDIGLPDEERSGFVGYTFVPPDIDQSEYFDLAVVAFRGSESLFKWDHLRTDWIETDLNIAVGLDSTKQSEQAKMYLLNVLSPPFEIGNPYIRKPIKGIVTGHSLGGYLALVASLFNGLGRLKEYERVLRCDTFDAPGLDELYIDRYIDELQTASFTVNEYQNEIDPVSNCNTKITKPKLIETAYISNITFDYHSPFYMKIVNNQFVYLEGENIISRMRKAMLEITEKYVKDLLNGNMTVLQTPNGFSLEGESLSLAFMTEKDELGRITKITDSNGKILNVKWEEETIV